MAGRYLGSEPRDGLFGAPRLRVVLGAQAHASVFKALGLLGLGQPRVERVPVDDQGRMIASRMPALDPVCLVIAQAGNVNSGAFDPFEPICDQTRKADAWLHIDGAFGLWAAAYLVGGQGRDGMHYAPEMSRRARTVDLWATMKSLGLSGIEALIDGLCAHARHFARLLQAQSFRILNEAVSAAAGEPAARQSPR